MELARYQTLFSILWVVWFFLLFSGILLWTLWPSRRRRLQEHAQIPLRQGD